MGDWRRAVGARARLCSPGSLMKITKPGRRRKIIRRVGAGIGIATLAAITAFFIAFDWNWLKPPIEKAVAESTGRSFKIQGNLSGEWRLHPRVRMEQVQFA